MDYYDLEICGLKRRLPILPLGPKLKIASFNLLGDAQLVNEISKEIVLNLKKHDFDIVVGLEVKTLPLIYEVSRLLKKDRYVILRKQYVGYMVKPLKTEGRKVLYLDGKDVEVIRNKKVCLVDDVVSTGRTIGVAADLIKRAGGKVSCTASVIKQGEQKYDINTPYFYITTLPIFDKHS